MDEDLIVFCRNRFLFNYQSILLVGGRFCGNPFVIIALQLEKMMDERCSIILQNCGSLIIIYEKFYTI